MALPTSIIQDVSGLSAYDWAKESGLNWSAKKVPLHYFDDNGLGHESERVSVIRDDTGEELGVVSKTYQIVQPSEILAGFENAVNNLGAGFQMDGIGMFNNGRLIWGRASSDHPIRIKGTDSLNSYLYMITSFDGSVSTMGFVSTLRAICSNALHLVSGKGDKLFSLSHRSEYKGQASSALDSYMKQVDEFTANANALSDKRMSPEDVVGFYTKLLYPNKSDFTEREKTTIKKYINVAATGAGSKLESVGSDVNGMSAWGVVNGVTNVVDHGLVRASKDEDKKAYSAFLGAGNALKSKAWKKALELV